MRAGPLAPIADYVAHVWLRLRAEWHRNPLPLVALVLGLQVIMLALLLIVVVVCGE